MDLTSITGAGGITAIVLLLAQAIKKTNLDNKWIPFICGILGGLLGIAGYYLMPDFPAADLFTAITTGVVSGLAATGAHQTYKQLTMNN